MKTCCRIPVLLAAVALLAAAGCSKKADPDSELTKAAAVLETAPPAPAPAPEVAVPQPVQPAQPEPVPTVAPAQQVKQALAAYKGGNMEDAVTRLQKLRATPSMTPQQRIALNDAMAAVMTEIYALAEKGDARAIAAVAQYERMQTGRR